MSNSVKFKCKLSGNVFEFFNSYDIDDMRTHPQYEEVGKEETKVKEVKPKKKLKGEVS